MTSTRVEGHVSRPDEYRPESTRDTEPTRLWELFCYQSGMPILSDESDGYALSPSFLRQVDVHIHQVLKPWQNRHSVVEEGMMI